ncbi:hypothetical protein GCM10022226_38310 [Sphaerisporangium flaviroseum]|uniref:Uncharacterized protein n=1 Tax=Sphaerisporangium flaviroseum TaxID=509199 RepID=A0ABP7IAW5_9ACTN
MAEDVGLPCFVSLRLRVGANGNHVRVEAKARLPRIMQSQRGGPLRAGRRTARKR